METLDPGSKIKILREISWNPVDLMNLCTSSRSWLNFCTQDYVITILKKADYGLEDRLKSLVFFHFIYKPMNLYQMEWLIKMGCSPDLLVLRAIDYQISGVIENLIHLKIPFNLDSALAEAVQMKRLSLVKQLLKMGANPDIQHSNHKYPLQMATENEDLSTMEALLQAGANPNRYNEEWGPILNYAIIWEQIPEVQLLLMYGAIPQLKIPHIPTHLILARMRASQIHASKNAQEILRLLEEKK